MLYKITLSILIFVVANIGAYINNKYFLKFKAKDVQDQMIIANIVALIIVIFGFWVK